MTKVQALYIHIPFCHSICAYCDFTRSLYNKEIVDKYLDCLKQELKEINTENITTIYIGGGTPSTLTLQQLTFLFDSLQEIKNIKEFTIEVNPESLNQEKVQIFRQYGVNRVSLGVQSTNNKLLSLLQRKHNFDQVKSSVELLKKCGIKNISVDLMYSLPTQTMSDWQQSLQDIIKLDINHISLYSLTIESGSCFGINDLKPLDSEIEEEMYFYAIDFLKSQGYHQYEVSNFARNNSESQHNLFYWRYANFYGIGLGASGKIDQKRYTNTTNILDYLNGIRKDIIINLTTEDEMFEYIMMNLRLKTGIDKKEFQYRFNMSIYDKYSNQLENLIRNEQLVDVNTHIKATPKHFSLLNEILSEFLVQ